ncbi:sporulation protein YabP [Halobacteroides halobius DSM 5150]|uniref:Sporulation protein YabP n=1 Tax=Halobacteroides halobius (strain ATCC 35273 / DSM 5150 / MD-1) TaxID=748449 RepID=L0K6H9_HALHC|nr:sporulation protein YabP [Halobacteroides halobius]AGB40140.1 sporulation protein YabP [Halobacteroides halobius DSM 5150]
MSKDQELSLFNREKLELNGVTDVQSYDEHEINLETNLGSLLIMGQELHIQHLDLENLKLIVEGHIIELRYDQGSKTKNLFQKLFK